MSDNGYGAKDNSADFLLRVDRLAPNFKTADGGQRIPSIQTEFVLRDPDHKIDFRSWRTCSLPERDGISPWTRPSRAAGC